MTPADTLRGIIARVEQAEGADRELDRDIARIFVPSDAEDVARSSYGWSYRVFGPSGWDEEWVDAKPYTASLDAAVSLVPNGFMWGVKTDYGDLNRGSIYHAIGPEVLTQADAATPALALTAAALRARLSMMEDGA